ncbi:hypothetical protein ACFE04_000804 [Oxalis oulophora]
MSHSKKLVLFGSFTEDETKSILLKKSSSTAEKPVKKTGFQFGSVNFDGESIKQFSANVPLNFQPSINKTEKDHSSKVAEPVNIPKQNGSIKKVDCAPALDNGVKEQKVDDIDLSKLHVSPTEVGSKSQLQNSTFHLLEGESEEEKNHSGVSVEGSVQNSKIQTEKVVDGNLVPRGLINTGNLCFLNATIQSLLSCSPFVQLLRDIGNRNIPKVGYPTLTAFAEFISNFEMSKKDAIMVETGRPFTPNMFEGVLKKFTPDVPNSMFGRPRQEDAQEFLSFIMDQMHDELLKLEGQSKTINESKSSNISYSEDDEWETVGPKNKSAVTRTQSVIPSELSSIFGGQLRSEVRAQGNKPSATIQPYLLLHLDIYPEAVRSIEDALHLFAAPENLEGYRAPVGKAGLVSAKKDIKIHTLSKIMILHLMRFSYGNRGSTKLHKPVHFPLEFVLSRDLLASTSTEGRKYELVATLTHHGREPSKGHYTSDARQSNGQWLRFDDASVNPIKTNRVLHDQAYVLFYRQV